MGRRSVGRRRLRKAVNVSPRPSENIIADGTKDENVEKVAKWIGKRLDKVSDKIEEQIGR